MKHTTVVTDFKDLRKAIEEVTKKNPAKSRYKQQAEKMGYTKDKAVVAEQTISEASALDGMMDIVKTKGAKKVNDANKKKMEKANVQTLVKLAQRVMGLNASNEFDKDPLKGFPYNESEFHLFSNKKDADKKAKEIKGKVITGKGKSQGQFMAVKESFDEGLKEENLQEGTWAIPDSYKKLYNLQVGFLQMPSKPTKANAKRMAKNIYSIFGDDGFFDDLLDVETGEDTETEDLRDLIVKHLEPWGLKFKKGAKYQITHAPQSG